LSDPTGMIASPHSVVDRRSEDVIAAIVRLCAEEEIAIVVVGLPISLSGTEGASAAMARSLGEEVADRVDIPVVYYDERFTSVQAEAALLEAGMRRRRRKENRDKVAAAVMLQGYLDREASR